MRMETVSVSLLIHGPLAAHICFFVLCRIWGGFGDASAGLPSEHSADDSQPLATLFLNSLLSAPNGIYGMRRRRSATLRTAALLLCGFSRGVPQWAVSCSSPCASLVSGEPSLQDELVRHDGPASCTPSITAHPRYFRPQARRPFVSVAGVRGDGASRP